MTLLNTILLEKPGLQDWIDKLGLKFAKYVTRMGECKSALNALAGKFRGNTPPGKHRDCWDNKIRMVLK